jgi:hypothetical protein
LNKDKSKRHPSQYIHQLIEEAVLDAIHEYREGLTIKRLARKVLDFSLQDVPL